MEEKEEVNKIPPPNPPPAGDKGEKDKTRHRGTFVKRITGGTILVDDLEMEAQIPPHNPPPDFGVSAQSNAGDREEPTQYGQVSNLPLQEGDKSRERDYKNESQQNLIKIVEYLARDVFKPAATQEIMEALALTKSKAHWTLHNLKLGGWAEQVSSGWRLSPELVKIADSVRATLKEVMHRYL